MNKTNKLLIGVIIGLGLMVAALGWYVVDMPCCHRHGAKANPTHWTGQDAKIIRVQRTTFPPSLWCTCGCDQPYEVCDGCSTEMSQFGTKTVKRGAKCPLAKKAKGGK